MVIKNYIPERGDIVWLNFDPQSGHEQKGKRPAIVLSPKETSERVEEIINKFSVLLLE